MTWKKVEEPEQELQEDPTFWRPEAMGESRVGKLVEVDPDAGKFEGSILYVFEGEDINPEEHRDKWKKWGARQLDGVMKQVNIGDRVKITFIQTHPSKKGRPWQEYRVDRDEPEEMDGDTILPSSELAHPAEIPKRGDMVWAARGFLNDARENLIGHGSLDPTTKQLREELMKMRVNQDFRDDKYSQDQLCAAAMSLLEGDDEK